MRRIGRITTLLVGLFTIGMFALAGCSLGIKYDKYANANLYTVGEVSVSADTIKKVEIDWLEGSVEVEKTTSSTLKVFEENGPDLVEERMRYYVDGNVLKVKYCQAGVRTNNIQAEKKNLCVEIPAGLSLEIDSVGTMVTVGVLEVSDLSIEMTSGGITAERIVADDVSIECTTAKVSIGEIVTKTASFDTTSGKIAVTKLSADRLEVETTTGDASFGIDKALSAEIESTSGDMTFTLNKGLGAVVHLESIMGKLKTDKPYGKVGSRYDVYGADGMSTECTIELDILTGDVYIK